MAQGVTPIRLYDQRSRVQSDAMPNVRSTDVTTNVGQALDGLGDGLNHVANIMVQREEDDARVYSAQALARYRASASEIRRTAFSEAQDGWRGVTERTALDLSNARDELIKGAPTPAAQRFIQENIAAFDPLFHEETAGQEETARRSWRLDTAAAAIDQDAANLVTDPANYETVSAQHLALIKTMTDLTADQRRDLEEAMNTTLAGAAAQAVLDRDPHAALRELRRSDRTGPWARLSASQIVQMRSRAETEIEQRAARWRASVREQIASAEYALENGVTPQNAPSVETVRSALGEQTAAVYGANLEAYSARSEMRSMTNADLNRVLTEARTDDSNAGIARHNARRAAAGAILQQRIQDPMASAIRDGMTSDDGSLARMIEQGDTMALEAQLVHRSSVASEQAQRLGLQREPLGYAPLTRAEAGMMRHRLDRMEQGARTAMLSRLRGRLNNASYAALARQLYGDSPASMAGMTVLGRRGAIEGADGNVDAATVSRRLIEGARLLDPSRQVEPDEEGAGRGGRGRTPPRPLDMPSESVLQFAWRANVGDAYASAPEQEAQAYQAFRAYYAARAQERGLVGADLRISNYQGDPDMGAALLGNGAAIATEAANAATGGVLTNRDGSRAYLPYGMSRESFARGLEAGWDAMRQTYSVLGESDPGEYEYRNLGGGLYAVTKDGVAITDPERGPVVVRFRTER